MTIRRLGFVGLGWIGKMRMEAVISAGAGYVVALCDAAPERAISLARQAGAVAVDSMEEMIARAGELGLDGIVIATPNSLHAPQAIAALDAGLAVFCQKPLALDAREARSIVAAANRADRLLGVDYSYRYTEGMRELYRIARGGQLGRVLCVESVFHNAYGPGKAWCHDPASAGGGALMDLGVHVIDLSLWVLGHPGIRSVHGRAFRNSEPLDTAGIDDFATARLELEGNTAVYLAVSWNAHVGLDCVIRTTVYGSNGSAEFRNLGGSFFDFELVRFQGRQIEHVTRDSRESLGRAVVAWAQQLNASMRYSPKAEESVIVAQIIDAIYQQTSATYDELEELMPNNDDMLQHAKIAVRTPGRTWPTEGFVLVPVGQRVHEQLTQALGALGIGADTNGWIASCEGRTVDIQATLEDNGLTDEVIIRYGPPGHAVHYGG